MSTEPKRNILLNPGPPTTSLAVKQAMVVPDICPREQEFGDLLGSITDDLIRLGKGEDNYECSLFAASGTGAVEAMLTSALSSQTQVLIVTNGAYGYRLRDICQAYELPHETVGEFGDYPNVDEIEQKLASGKFTHLAVIHHETSTGMMNPLEDFSRICKQTDVRLMVDAMSSFGGVPMNLNELDVDYLVASSNKCIHGMAGLSFVIFHKNCLPELENQSKNFYFDLYKQWSYLKEKNQLRFTPPVQICYAFRQALDETMEETVEARWQRYQNNWTVLFEGLQEFGFKPFLPIGQQSKILAAFKFEKQLPKGFDHFHDYLFERDITVYPGVIPETKTFRMAVIGDLYEKDLRLVVKTVGEYLDSVH